MKNHELKTLRVYFDAVKRGDKTFEIRNNDRDFQTGDTLLLKEYDPDFVDPPMAIDYSRPPLPQAPKPPGAFTGRELIATVSYVLHDTWEAFGLKRGFVVIGLRHVEDYAAVRFDENTRDQL